MKDTFVPLSLTGLVAVLVAGFMFARPEVRQQ